MLQLSGFYCAHLTGLGMGVGVLPLGYMIADLGFRL